MFNLFKKKDSPLREEVRSAFVKGAGDVHASDDVYQIAVGHVINLLNSMFIQRFGSIDGFCQRPTSEKNEYQKILAATGGNWGSRMG